MVNVAGIESVGFGTDFDGIECGLELENCSNMQVMAEVLRKRGLSEDQIEKIFYQNTMRLYKELL
jgi:membrane dipeptidase